MNNCSSSMCNIYPLLWKHDLELILCKNIACLKGFATARDLPSQGLPTVNPGSMDLLFWVMNPPISGKSRCKVGFTSQITNTIRRNRRSSSEDPHVSRIREMYPLGIQNGSSVLKLQFRFLPYLCPYWCGRIFALVLLRVS